MKLRSIIHTALALLRGSLRKLVLLLIGVTLSSAVISAFTCVYSAYSKAAGVRYNGAFGLVSAILREASAGKNLTDNEPLMMGALFLLALFISICLSLYLTYSIFNIHIINDRRQYLSLMCLGADRKRLTWLSVTQASIISFASLPVGNLIGTLCFLLLKENIGSILHREIDTAPSISLLLAIDGLLLLAGMIAVMIPTLRLYKKYPHDLSLSRKEPPRKDKTGNKSLTADRLSFYVANAHVRNRKKEHRGLVFCLSFSLILLLGFMQFGRCFEKTAVKEESAKDYDVSVTFSMVQNTEEFLSELVSASKPYAKNYAFCRPYSFDVRNSSSSLYLIGLDDNSFRELAGTSGITLAEGDNTNCILLTSLRKDNKYKDTYDFVEMTLPRLEGSVEVLPRFSLGSEPLRLEIAGHTVNTYMGQDVPMERRYDPSMAIGVVAFSDYQRLMKSHESPFSSYIHMFFESSAEKELTSALQTVADAFGVSLTFSVKDEIIREKMNTELFSVLQTVALVLGGFLVLSAVNILSQHFVSYREEYQMLGALGATDGKVRRIILLENLIYIAESAILTLATGYLLMVAIYLLYVNTLTFTGIAFDPIFGRVALLFVTVFSVVALFFCATSRLVLKRE